MHTRGTHAAAPYCVFSLARAACLSTITLHHATTATDLCMVSIWLRRRPCKFVLAHHPKLLQQSSLSSL